jgi:type I restriction enzyme M protein
MSFEEPPFWPFASLHCEEDAVESLSDLVAKFAPLHTYAAAGEILFRGEKSAKYYPTPSIDRPPAPCREAEERVLTDFARMLPSSERRSNETWLSLMALAAHHGVPTRLLDWSRSPLVAAHFAVDMNCRESSEDAAIFVLHGVAMLTPDDEPFEWDQVRGMTQVVAYEPEAISPRVNAQRSLFTVHPPGECAVQSRGLSMLQRVLIPRAARQQIYDELHYCGITADLLFPGLEGLSMEIARRARNWGNQAALRRSAEERLRPK